MRNGLWCRGANEERAAEEPRGQAEESKPENRKTPETLRQSHCDEGRKVKGQQELRQVMNAGKDTVEQSGKGDSAGEAYMQGCLGMSCS